MILQSILVVVIGLIDRLPLSDPVNFMFKKLSFWHERGVFEILIDR